MTKKSRKVVSLFSGAGGFDWGFHLAGYRTILACELLEDAAETLSTNLGMDVGKTPIAPRINNGRAIVAQGNVKDVDFSELNMTPDVLIGGPPCQDFSVIQSTKREGIHGKRGKLYLEFMRAVIQLQPKFFVFENVPGLVSANGGKVYNFIRKDLSDLGDQERLKEICEEIGIDVDKSASFFGYDLLLDEVIDATSVGVSQTRRRLIIIGIRRDLLDKYHILKQYQLRDTFANKIRGKQTVFPTFPMSVMEVFEGKTLLKLQAKYREIIESYSDLKDADIPIAEEWYSKTWSKLTGDIRDDYFLENGIDRTPHNFKIFDKAMMEHEQLLSELGWLNKPVYEIVPEDGTNSPPSTSEGVADRMYMIPPNENYQFVQGTQWEVTAKVSFIYRRSSPLKPAWTVIAYGGGGSHGYHYERTRSTLTLRERARIQTFSDDFRFCGTFSDMRAQIGEAVPPLLGKRIAESIRDLLDDLES